MTSWTNMLKEFHKASEINDPDKPDLPSLTKRELRRKLIQEEYHELLEEIDKYPHDVSIEKIAKECADLIYVVIGTALAYGIPMDKVFAEVHRSNMTKFVNGKAIRREDGKILKPESYEPPDMGIIWDD